MSFSSHQRKYKHLFFDLDHTLWDFETNSKITLEQLYNSYQLNNYFNSFNNFYEHYQTYNIPLWNDYRERKINKNTLNLQRFYQPFKAAGFDSKEIAQKFSDDYLELSPLQTTLMPGAFDTLNYLHQNYKLHIITNGFKKVQELKIKGSGLLPFFDKLYTSEGIGASKPHKHFFEHAIKSSNARKKECLVIGDSLEADIQGAKNFGLDHILFNPHKNNHNSSVMREIHHLTELLKIL